MTSCFALRSRRLISFSGTCGPLPRIQQNHQGRGFSLPNESSSPTSSKSQSSQCRFGSPPNVCGLKPTSFNQNSVIRLLLTRFSSPQPSADWQSLPRALQARRAAPCQHFVAAVEDRLQPGFVISAAVMAPSSINSSARTSNRSDGHRPSMAAQRRRRPWPIGQ